MSSVAPVHHKLPGLSLTWKGLGRLWQAEDHLLEATWLLVLEQYRRFYFRETKAFVVQPTKVRLVWAWLQGGFGGICTLTAGIALWFGMRNSAEDWHVVFYVVAAIVGAVALVCLLLLVINLLLGPSCRCYVLTATGWHALAAPGRLGAALQVQARVFPLIEAAQERLSVVEPGTS